ncbi:MAG: hypothetical protein AW09_004364 [Candidatus Accumulibacter phosphatis]|uniref:Uncharacterized protein n=1 Tax=Candidatus Accumulibacter phosphatis TaxID=327160 RepID=A0A084Y744_9PROT|nr:MAG: hypothetical protein AW09_004364 [Candidatus Accumulibacter phosphatis]
MHGWPVPPSDRAVSSTSSLFPFHGSVQRIAS